MPRSLRTAAIGAAVAVGSLAAAPLVGATSAIKAHQHFVGLVNGSHNGTVRVRTACGGPGGAHTGPVAGDQTLSVARVARDAGDTGVSNHVYAWFVPPKLGPAPKHLVFTSYNRPQSVPSTILVPCSGPGRVAFSSCPYRAPCAAGFVVSTVRVEFVNVAA